MKTITVNTKIQTLINVNSEFSDKLISTGTMGTIVECYDNPTGYAVDLAILNDNLGGLTKLSRKN